MLLERGFESEALEACESAMVLARRRYERKLKT
jgi:hypothetical protein